MINQQAKGVLLCLFAVVTWGGMFPVMSDALKVTNPFMFTAIRYTAVAGLLLLVLLRDEGIGALRVEGRGWKLWTLGSAGFAGFGFLVFLGQEMAGTAGVVVAAVMMALMPMLSVIINWVILNKRPVRYSTLFVVISFVGVVLVVTKGELASLLAVRECLLAAGVILLGALCWVIYTIGATTCPDWSALRYTTLTSALSLPTILGANVLLSIVGTNPLPSKSELVELLPHVTYMVVVTGILGVLAWNQGNRILSPMNGVLFMNVVPVTAGAVAVFQGYAFAPGEIVGAVLTLLALVLHNVSQRFGGVLSKPNLDSRRV